MKKVYLPLFFSLLISSISSAQQSAPPIQWQKCLGGTGNDNGTAIVRSNDGGYLITGVTTSVDGNVTVNHGSTDIWVAKLSNTGVLQWQKNYGGNYDDYVSDVKNTPDGGYIIACSTTSYDAGFSDNHGSTDAVLIKINSVGDIQWQKCYGGTSDDYATQIQVTADGYIFAGQTNSNNGDVSGNHGGVDIWLVKTDKQGSIQWQKCLGGPGYEYMSYNGTSYTNGGAIIQTSDGNYILVGYVYSNGGDVTGFHSINTTFPQPANQWPDTWVVKINNTGNIIWQKCLGGTNEEIGNDIIELNNGDYFVLSTSFSQDGDVTGSRGGGDIWLVRLSSLGSIIWQKSYGGSKSDNSARIKRTPDNNFVILGETSSYDGDVSGLHTTFAGYGDDGWLIEINEAGSMLWQKPIGGGQPETPGNFVFADDGEIVSVLTTQSANGDVSGSYNPPGLYSTTSDIWVVKTGGYNIIKGCAFIDKNANGIKDSGEIWVNDGLISSDKPGYSWQTFIKNGIFSNRVDSGLFSTTLKLPKPYYTTHPISKQTNFVSFFNTDSIAFSLTPIAGKTDSRISLFAITPARPGRASFYRIKYENEGTDTLTNIAIRLIKDSRVNFQSASHTPVSTLADTITWNIPTILPSDSGFITISVFLPGSLGMFFGKTLLYTACIDSTGDLDTSDNTSTLNQLITNSFDPNDKQEVGGGSLTTREISNNKYLLYTIRFQNTGNDTSFNISVRDTLDSKLDWSTIDMIDASHPYNLNIKDGKYCTWQFNNILLADSNHNEPMSHGYITYRIKPTSSVALGDTISNSASIYFDFNLPVKTNTQLTVVKSEPLPLLPVVSGLKNNYCSNLGIQKGKINNLPLATSGITTMVKLNGTVLAVAADSTFSFDVTSIPAGANSIMVLFTNSAGSDTALYNISINTASIPNVNLSSNITTVTNLTDPVIITATNAAGGGTSPKYTFAKDRNISNVLQAEGNSNTLTIQPNTLTVGPNWIYARMKTSDTCYTTQTNIDSIDIERSAVTGLTDVDFPNQVINVYPNPFSNVINITGLNTGKTYTIIINNSTGQKLYSQQIINSANFSITKTGLQAGKYWLSIYDFKKHKLIGTVSVIKE